MIRLQRPAKPPVLVEHEEEWKEEWIRERAEGSTRPDKRRYGHPQVRVHLWAMTHGKCAWCEVALSEKEAEVDHIFAVSTAPDRAFDWSNLHLSCPACNRRKLPDTTLPPEETLDPARQPAPEDHLEFDDELIRPRDGSTLGERTIQKLRLDRPDLAYLRLRALQRLRDEMDRIKDAQIRDGRQEMTPGEQERLRSFASPFRPFSLMFRDRLLARGLLRT